FFCSQSFFPFPILRPTCSTLFPYTTLFRSRPKLLLADEPTGNLDPGTADEIFTLLNQINRHGTTVVMSTHNARAVNDARQRVIELSNGNLVRDEHNAEYGEA